MLVITRKDGQSVVLVLPDGRRVRVVVRIEWNRNRARLAFDAPCDVAIYRSEIAPKESEVANG